MSSFKIKQFWKETTSASKLLIGFLIGILVLIIGNKLLLNSLNIENRKLKKESENIQSALVKKELILESAEKQKLTLKKELEELNKKLKSRTFAEGTLRKGNHIKTVTVIDSLLEGIGLLIIKRKENIQNSNSDTVAAGALEKSNLGVVIYHYSLEGDFRKIFYFFSNVNRISLPFKIVNISITNNTSEHKFSSNKLNLSFDLEVPYLKYGKL